MNKSNNSDERRKFLVKLSTTIFTSFDDNLTLQKVAKQLVPGIADYCRIAVLDENGQIKEIAVDHTDPTKIQLVSDLYDSYKDRPENTHGVPKILKTGKPEMIPNIDKTILDTVKNNPRLLKIIKRIGLKSYIGVPLIARNKIVGAMSISSVKEGRHYTQDDFLFVQDIARKVALALDNARLYSEAKNSRLEAEKERQRLAYGQQAGKIGTYEWDLLTNISTWTKEFEAVYGYPNGGYKAGTTDEWVRYVHPDDRKMVLDETANALKNGRELNIEYRIIWPDKSLHYISNRAQIIRDKKGKAIRINGVNIDITERKLIENNINYLAEVSKALSSSLDYKTTLSNVANLTVPVIADWCSIDIKTENGIEQLAIAHIDPKKVKWAKELRMKDPPDPASPTGIPKVMRSGSPEFFPDVNPDVLMKGARNKEQAKLLKKLAISSIMIVPLIVRKETIGTITFIAAESNRKYTKADLAMASEVATRAALAIENARLYTDAQRAIATRDDFISVASHELKTPVTSLKMYTQVLQREFDSTGGERILTSLAKMDSQINKLTLLISDLLNVSRLQLGQLELHMESFDVNEVIAETVEAVSRTTDKHSIQIKETAKTNIWGDKDRIGQVLTNLLTNAIKYSPKSDKIVVSVTPGKNFATITVQDFGIGIGKEHLPKLFNRFYRVTGSEETTYPGLGIGLYISNEIVRLHGGKMNVQSDKGKGSKFSFSIPYNKTDPQVTPIPQR